MWVPEGLWTNGLTVDGYTQLESTDYSSDERSGRKSSAGVTEQHLFYEERNSFVTNMS